MKESLKVVCFQLKRTFIPFPPAALTSSCSWSFWAFVLAVAPDSPDDNKVCRCHTRPGGAGPGSSYRCHSCRKTCHTVNVTGYKSTTKQQKAKPQPATQRLTSNSRVTGRTVCTICFWSTQKPTMSTVFMLMHAEHILQWAYRRL